MNPESTTALFRAHATARLRGDTTEASRLAARIEPGQRMTHQVFLVALLAQAVIEEYGAQPDPTDLAAITKRLHDKHFPTNPNFNALRAEAMIRAVCGDSVLLTEIPHSEQPAYLWAMIGELVEPDLADAELTELFDQAEDTGLACLTEAFEETIRNHPKRTGQQEPPPEPPTTSAADNNPESAILKAADENSIAAESTAAGNSAITGTRASASAPASSTGPAASLTAEAAADGGPSGDSPDSAPSVADGASSASSPATPSKEEFA